jgi:hypothetical protein
MKAADSLTSVLIGNQSAATAYPEATFQSNIINTKIITGLFMKIFPFVLQCYKYEPVIFK